jgi:hypothetical protein
LPVQRARESLTVIPPTLLELVLFMALVLVLSLYGLTVSGHFPAQFRAPSLRSRSGAIVVWTTLAAALGQLLCALVLLRRLPLYAAVIGAGCMILIAPLILQPLPDRFVDGRCGLLVLAFLGLGLAIIAGLIVP